MNTKKTKKLLTAGVFFILGIAFAYIVFLVSRQNKKLLPVGNPPITVEFKETNLPIVFINTNGKLKSLSQGKSINSQICIINNEDSRNYADTSHYTGHL